MKKIILLLLLVTTFSFFGSFNLEKNVQAAPIELPDVGLSQETPERVLGNILDKLLTIFIVLAIIAFIITGIMFLVSLGGATGTNQQAKQYFFYAIIGVVVGLSALIILNAVMGLFGSGGGRGQNVPGTTTNQDAINAIENGALSPSGSGSNVPGTTTNQNAIDAIENGALSPSGNSGTGGNVGPGAPNGGVDANDDSGGMGTQH